jgi:ZIP family zinc transporter
VNWTSVLIGFGASLAAGLMTGAGALPVLFRKHYPAAFQDALLGFAAGVMLAASFFSLILPGFHHAQRTMALTRPLAASVVLAALLLGAWMIHLLNVYVPRKHFSAGREGPDVDRIRRIWLFVIAITLHNLPEGLAVGVGFGGEDMLAGTKIAVAIGLQNVPEGLSVAVALASLGYGRVQACLVATATGLVEALGGLAGAAIVSLSEPLLPMGLGFAAGAMLFVISNEIIPETHRSGHETHATAGVLIGVVVMTFLDTTLG